MFTFTILASLKKQTTRTKPENGVSNNIDDSPCDKPLVKVNKKSFFR